MAMIEIEDKRWYEDKNWLKNLNIYLDALGEDDDLFMVFDGKEGAGKSKRLRQVGKYCANYLGTQFTNKNIKQDLQQYIDFSIESPHYTVCVLDEARNALNKRNALTKTNKKFTNYISECRKKRQVHIIALPAYHDLDKYVVLWRMKFLVHIHKWFEEDSKKKSGYKLARGRYSLYINDEYLKKCYLYPYAYPRRYECTGNFRNVEVLSEDELKLYDKDKDINIERRYHSSYEQEQLGQREKMWKERAKKMMLEMNDRGVPEKTIMDIIGFHKDRWYVFKSREKLSFQKV